MWKRVPVEVKQSDAEIVAAWAIGQRIWTGDYAAIYEAFKVHNWKPLAASLVKLLEGTTVVIVSSDDMMLLFTHSS